MRIWQHLAGRFADHADIDGSAAGQAQGKRQVDLRGRNVEQLRGLGHAAVVIDDALIAESALVGAVRALQMAGVTAVSARVDLREETVVALRELADEAFFESSQAVTAWLGRQA